MIVECESCRIQFNLDERLIKDGGSKVRCSKCRHVFTVYPLKPDPADSVVPEFLVPGSMVSATPVEEPLKDPEMEDTEAPALSLESSFPSQADENGKIPDEPDIGTLDALDLSEIDYPIDPKEVDTETDDEPELEEAARKSKPDSEAIDLDALEKMISSEPETVEPGMAEKPFDPGLELSEPGDRPDDRLDPGSGKNAVAPAAWTKFNAKRPSRLDERIKKQPPRKRTRPIFIFLLMLAALVGGAYTALDQGLLDRFNLPYVGDVKKKLNSLFSPEADAPVALKMKTIEITSRLIENRFDGKLFVVFGKVKNNDDVARGFIQIQGDLFAGDQSVIQTRTVYGGNLLSDMDLGNTRLADIHKRLNNRFGINNANVRVEPGGALPFMVVFSKVPAEQLEEFSLEVVGGNQLPSQ